MSSLNALSKILFSSPLLYFSGGGKMKPKLHGQIPPSVNGHPSFMCAQILTQNNIPETRRERFLHAHISWKIWEHSMQYNLFHSACFKKWKVGHINQVFKKCSSPVSPYLSTATTVNSHEGRGLLPSAFYLAHPWRNIYASVCVKHLHPYIQPVQWYQ